MDTDDPIWTLALVLFLVIVLLIAGVTRMPAAPTTPAIAVSGSQDFTVNVVSQPSPPPAPLVNVQGFWGAAAVVLLGSLGLTGGFLLILTVCVLVINQSFARQ
jgi:hypothetical protein